MHGKMQCMRRVWGRVYKEGWEEEGGRGGEERDRANQTERGERVHKNGQYLVFTKQCNYKYGINLVYEPTLSSKVETRACNLLSA